MLHDLPSFLQIVTPRAIFRMKSGVAPFLLCVSRSAPLLPTIVLLVTLRHLIWRIHLQRRRRR